MSTYDSWKTTEPADDDADQREIERRELEDDMAAHPEAYGLDMLPEHDDACDGRGCEYRALDEAIEQVSSAILGEDFESKGEIR